MLLNEGGNCEHISTNRRRNAKELSASGAVDIISANTRLTLLIVVVGGSGPRYVWISHETVDVAMSYMRNERRRVEVSTEIGIGKSETPDSEDEALGTVSIKGSGDDSKVSITSGTSTLNVLVVATEFTGAAGLLGRRMPLSDLRTTPCKLLEEPWTSRCWTPSMIVRFEPTLKSSDWNSELRNVKLEGACMLP